MKVVNTNYMPKCDISPHHGDGLYNSPTRRDDAVTGGKWANLCENCFARHGLDTSITERRMQGVQLALIYAVVEVPAEKANLVRLSDLARVLKSHIKVQGYEPVESQWIPDTDTVAEAHNIETKDLWLVEVEP